MGRGMGPGGGGMESAVELTATQKEQIQALREEHRAEMQEMRGDGEVSREDMQAIREQHREAVHSLLTDEQKATLEELRTQRGGMGDGLRRGRGLSQGADLTEAQKAELQELRASFREQVQALRESGDMDRDAFRALRQEHREAVEAIVTGTQSEGTAKPAAAVQTSTWGRIKSIF